MAQIHSAWVERQRRTWLRHDWQKWVRPDWQRWMPPDPGPSPHERLWRPYREEPSAETSGPSASEIAALRQSLSALRVQLAEIKAELRRKAFNPNQPRVPAGNPDGGQWTNGGGSRTRFAAADKPRLGPGTMAAIAAEVARRVIEAHRSENGLWDLFGRKEGTVTFAAVNGSDVFGSNSTSPTYTSVDYAAATRMRDTLLEKYPGVMETDNIGRRPNDAVFHAESTVLLRAARANGGTLSGQTLEVFADRPLCRSYDTLLPYIGRELGNPTVTFVGPTGVRKTMRNGSWVE